MNLFFKKFFAAVLLAGAVSAQESVTSNQALIDAGQRLTVAQAQLKDIEQGIASEAAPLVRELQNLEEQLRAKDKTRREKEALEVQLAGSEKRLDNNLASRRGEFEYTTSLLKSYSDGFLTRLHPAESQLYQENVENLKTRATNTEDLKDEILIRLEAVRLGAQRLQEVAGGSKFEGKALIGSDVVPGQFVTLGSVGYFSSNDGSTSGLTTIANDGFPLVAKLEDENGAAVAKFVKNGGGVLPLDATSGKALKAVTAKRSIKSRLEDGGPVGYAILGLGALATLIALFKFIEITTFYIPGTRTINKILDALLERDMEGAQNHANAVRGLSGKMVEAGVENFYGKRRILEDALLEKLSAIQPRLERMLPFLALVAAAAPMMGLLGTVLGIMETFDEMAKFGTGNAQNFSQGIGAALVTTAEGLVVAIPIIIIHGMLKSLARGRFDRAQGAALSILNGTTEIDVSADSGKDQGNEEEDFDETELSPA